MKVREKNIFLFIHFLSNVQIVSGNSFTISYYNLIYMCIKITCSRLTYLNISCTKATTNQKTGRDVAFLSPTFLLHVWLATTSNDPALILCFYELVNSELSLLQSSYSTRGSKSVIQVTSNSVKYIMLKDN